MKNSYLTHGAWALAVLSAFLIGQFSSSNPSAEGAAADGPAMSGKSGAVFSGKEDAAKTEPGERAAKLRSGKTTRLGNGEVDPEMFEALAEPDAFLRMKKVVELLDKMTPENWESVKAAFLAQTVQEGRTHHSEWWMLMTRIGQVGGKAAADSALKGDARVNVNSVVTGWASADPKAALAWARTLPEGRSRQDMIAAVIEGAAQNDPGWAYQEILAGSSGQPLDGGLGTIIEAAMQRGGFPEAEKMFARIRGDEAAGKVSADGVRDAFGALAGAVGHAANVGNTPERALDFFFGHTKDGNYPRTDGVASTVSGLAAKNPQRVLDWFGQMQGKLSDGDMTMGMLVVGRSISNQNPQQLQSWLNNNADQPAADWLRATMSANQKTPELQKQWADQVKDPAILGRAMEVLNRQKGRN